MTRHLRHRVAPLTVALLAMVLSPLFTDQLLRATPHQPPNILLVMADDLGYSDLGCYGGEIETPNLDKLAVGGVRFTQFHNTARCWPTRAALLTGYYAQQVRRDTLPGIPSGGRGQRPSWAKLLPARLRDAGYRSYHSGKWHLDGMPISSGFDRSYYLRDQGRFFNPKVHFEDDRKLPPVEPGSGFYGTTAIADHAIRCLKEHAQKHTARPFFHYLAFTAPHFPLQALPQDIARYQERYREGWEVLREQRWKRIKEQGLISGGLSEVERQVGPPYHFPEALMKLGSGETNRPLAWSELTDEQRTFQATKMAIHAAMIDRVDRELGRVLSQLREMKAMDNTLIFFLSDNGASAEIMVRDDGHDPSAAPGSAATYLCLGPGWSTTANTPFRRHKTWVHEGGIATPLIAHWPRGIKARGQLRHKPGHVIDIAPTILELAGLNADARRPADKGAPEFPGKSLTPLFSKDEREPHDNLWWLHEGNRALRIGQWKLVAAKGDPWELYDLENDATETKNLAAKHPERVRRLEQVWQRRFEEFRQIALRDLPEQRPKRKGKAREQAKRAVKEQNVKQQPNPVKRLILPGESFRVQGRAAFIMQPPKDKRLQPQPWIFYAPTLPGLPDRHEKWMHEQFLAAGVAVAGIDVGEGNGSPQSQKLFDALYLELVGKRGFTPRPCLLGRSRGGLWMTSWAISNPHLVAGLGGIYPVFDLTSYPGVARAAKAYELTPDQLKERLKELNPINRVDELARAGVPALLIHGDQDKVVPLERNSAEFVRRYKAAGAAAAVELVTAEGQGHNFWEGFFHCQPLIEFVIARAKSGATVDTKVVAHRGLLLETPENTLPNFSRCLELGLGFEVDVRRARDGHLVCVHDSTLQRTTNGVGPVSELTLEQLSKLDAGTWFDRRFRGEKIPTLEEVFALLAKAEASYRKAGKNEPWPVLLAVDVKGTDERIEADILKLARRHKVVDRLLMIGRTIDQPAVRRRFRAADSQCHIACLANTSNEFAAALADAHADWVYVRYLPSYVESAKVHAAGKRLFIAGAMVAGKEPENWRRASANGVDAILTDYSRPLQEQLHQRRRAAEKKP